MGAAAQDDKGRQVVQFVGAPPGGQRGDVVFADEIKKLGLRPEPLAQGQEGVDGVGRARAVKLQVIHIKTGLVFNGRADHLRTQVGRSRLEGGLVRRDGVGNEIEPVKPQFFHSFAGQDQVTVVNGVEGAAVKSELHGAWGNLRHPARGR